MKLETKRFLSVVILIVFVGLVQACASSSTPRVNPESSVVGAASTLPTFAVSSLTVNPPEANTGVSVIVTAKVTNTGNTKDSYNPKIRIDNVAGGALPSFRYLKDVEIPTGKTELLSFVLPSESPGRYKVTWGDLSEEFTVVKDAKHYAGDDNASNKVAAPDFTSVDVVNNQQITLSSFKGSMVLLNFVNYGCDPSLNNVVSKQLLAIKELYSQRKDFTPVSVFCGCCPPEVLRDFAEQNDLAWSWILDTDYSIVNSYLSYLRQYGYPTLIFIDQEQYIREVTGYSDLPTLSAKLNQISVNSN
ncbi:MAG: peroxiredoxin family protein [Chloroflexi bacterium]|nr:peroxiredoxin family protein [Chloroflexota bacterium]